MDVFIVLGSNPTPEVAFACGSASIIKVLNSNTAKAAPKLMAVVVFPTPPFWLAMEIILPICGSIIKIYRVKNQLLNAHSLFPVISLGKGANSLQRYKKAIPIFKLC
jgi:hypothetical protein